MNGYAILGHGGGGGRGGHGGRGHGRGGGWGPWPWGYPAGYYAPLVYEDVEPALLDADRIADLVAEKLAAKTKTHVGVVPPFQVLQQQNAGIPPGGVPPWYAMQYPAGYVPPLLVSVDNPMEPDPFDTFDEIRFRGERDRRDLERSHLLPGLNIPTYLNGYAILGSGWNAAEPESITVGTYDAFASQRQMNSLRQVTVGIARTLLKGGQDAIAAARDLGKETLTRPALSRGAARDNVHWKLDWHAKELAKATSPTAIYAPGEDLKKWVQEAFIEFNAAEAGREESERAAQRRWDSMWSAVGEAVASLPGAIAAIPGAVVKGVTGVPLWAWSVGGLLFFGLVGYGAYRILLAAAPAATPILAARYLPR